MEKRLSNFNPITIVVCYGFFMTAGSLVLRQVFKTTEPGFDFPVGISFVWFLLLGILFLVGDLAHAKAFTLQGKSEIGLQIFSAAPIVVMLIKYIRYKEKLEPIQFIGYMLFFVSLYFIFGTKKS